jgi:hypothetical protein
MLSDYRDPEDREPADRPALIHWPICCALFVLFGDLCVDIGTAALIMMICVWISPPAKRFAA